MAKKTKHSAPPRNQTSPRDIDRWLERATRQMLTGDYAGVSATAQRVLRAPIASPEQRAQAYHSMAVAYALQGRHDDAFATVSQALALAPDDAMAWYNRGMAARFTMRLGQSLRDFERAQALDTQGVLAEKLAEALPFARDAAERERVMRGPDFTLDQLIEQEELFQQGVRVMSEHRWEEAERLFRAVIAMGDVLPQPQGNLGLCLIMQRRFDETEVALRRALAIEPGYDLARQNLAALPAIRASGKLPEMRINDPMREHKGAQQLSVLVQREQR